MKLVLVTPLYPPDTGGPAPYMKELAKRLADRHDITLVTYGRYPEAVEGVHVIAIDKAQPLLQRLSAYTKALREAAKNADALFVANGASTELPALICSFGSPVPFLFAPIDSAAGRGFLRGILGRVMRARSRAILADFPLPRPELLPLEPEPTEALEAYERSWERHRALIEATLDHAG